MHDVAIIASLEAAADRAVDASTRAVVALVGQDVTRDDHMRLSALASAAADAALAVVRAYGSERPTAAAYYRAIAAEFAMWADYHLDVA